MSKYNIFSADQFTPTEFTTAEDKAKFANFFVRFVSEGFKKGLFQKQFYHRLSMTRGHIAHYNADGFYNTWFATTEDQQRFIDHWRNEPVFGDPAYTFSDVERELQSWIQQNEQKIASIIEDNAKVEQAAHDVEDQRVRNLEGENRQEFAVAQKSSNTNSFGLYGIILVAKDGSAWEAAHGYLDCPEQGDVVSLGLDGNSEPIFTGYEIPRRLKNAPQEVVDAVWDASRQTA
jgi:hypothetical protein